MPCHLHLRNNLESDCYEKAIGNLGFLQVEPKRFMDKDKIQIDYHEALYIEKTRNRFFAELRKLIQELPLI